MFQNTNTTIPHVNDDTFRDAWAKAMHQGTIKNSPGVTITSNSTGTSNGLWNQINSTGSVYNIEPDPFEIRMIELEKNMELVQTELSLMQLRLLLAENKFSKQEIDNMRDMILSKDEASITLAKTIIENA